jgi:hypothetical protein
MAARHQSERQGDVMQEVLMSFRPSLTAALVLGALALGATPAPADTANHNNCFLSSNWSGWKSPDPNTIYLRVDVNRIFRLDLAHPSYSLNDPSVHLVSVIRGSSWICSPLDLQMRVADDHGAIREPLFVKSITQLTPDEVKAIPAKFRP